MTKKSSTAGVYDLNSTNGSKVESLVSTEKGDQRILVVDDEDGIRFLLEGRLKKLGYRVEVAGNGLHALQKIRAGFSPDLIVCDMKMPGMDGASFLQQIRADEKLTHIPFLIVTGFAEKDLILKAKQFGANNILLKPIDNEELTARLQALLPPPPEPPES